MMDFKKFKPIWSKNHVKDPVRYPSIVNSYEGEAKEIFSEVQNKMYVDVIKAMVKIRNSK